MRGATSWAMWAGTTSCCCCKARTGSGAAKALWAPSPARRASCSTTRRARPEASGPRTATPFEQTIVADGKTLWLYDADLNQVTQRPQAQALGSTPAAILASANDLKALSAD